MKRKPLLRIICAALITESMAVPASASFEDFWSKVQIENASIRAIRASIDLLEIKASESSLAVVPSFFSEATLLRDERPTVNPGFQGSMTELKGVKFGLQSQTRFGLGWKVYYQTGHQLTSNVTPTVFPGGSIDYIQASPVIELQQSLWKNGFGSELRAQIDAGRAEADAKRLGELFQWKAKRLEAELAYYNYISASRVVLTQARIVARAREFLNWATRRAHNQLGDKSDAYQAEAVLRMRELEYLQAEEQKEIALRGINSLLEAPELQEFAIAEPNLDAYLRQVPSENKMEPAESREDIAAMERSTEALKFVSQLSSERTKPVLDVFGSFSLNGLKNNFGDALSQASSFDHTNLTLGIRFQFPLDFSLASDLRRAAASERDVLEARLLRRKTEVNREASNLRKRYREATKRLALVKELSELQKIKHQNEEDRYNRGRTTTVQVLMFEQDYSQSMLSLIRAEQEVVSLAAQLKLNEI